MSRIFKILSLFNIPLGAACMAIHAAAVVAFNSNLRFLNNQHIVIDAVGWGIWSGFSYIVCGMLGITLAYTRTSTLLQFVRLSALSALACSLASMILSGVHGEQIRINTNHWCVSYFNGKYVYFYKDCHIWMSLEWSLLAVSLVAFLLNMVVNCFLYEALYSHLTLIGIDDKWELAEKSNGGFRNLSIASSSVKQTQV